MKVTRVTIEINTLSDTFQPHPAPELIRILEGVIRGLRVCLNPPLRTGSIQESTGTTVGLFKVEHEEPEKGPDFPPGIDGS